MRLTVAVLLAAALCGCAGAPERQARWPEIMSRATVMAKQNATVTRLKYGMDVEVRVMAMPETWAPKVAGTCKKEVMNELADLGEKMGADPKSWSNGGVVIACMR